MAYLLDTGILLRLVDVQDRQHEIVRSSVRALISRREELLITTQNIAEFFNVTTRLAENNGLGIPAGEAVRLLERDVETICGILPEIDPIHSELKRLVTKYAVVGKQVHDARLVAMMLVWQIDNVLTLNDRDFRRYEPEGISLVTPTSIAAAGPY